MLPRFVNAPLDALRVHAGLSADDGAALCSEPVFSSFPASLDRVLPSSRMRPPFRSRVVESAPTAVDAAWATPEDPRPLVYITFGSIIGGIPHLRSVYRTSLDAVADLPVRALLTTGRGVEPGVFGAIPSNVHVEAWVPQRDVLSRAAMVVCHGGSGTVLGGLAAGLPMVIMGVGADQPHNGRLIAAAGAGLALTKPEASELRAAIQKVLGDAQLRARAAELASEIAAMPTMESAVDVLLGIASAA
jgi:MGT family glycosyltransferase